MERGLGYGSAMRRLRVTALAFGASVLLACSQPAPPPAAPMPSTDAGVVPSPTKAPTPLLRSLPVDLEAVDWEAVMENADLFRDTAPIVDYGFTHGAGTADERRNPQPTFHVPLGTPVLAPIDGVVVAIEPLYSGDLTIMFAAELGVRDIVWETEHVEDPSVQVGDTVRAGQPVAVVSDYACYYSREEFGNEEWCGRGIGLVELGYLVGGAVPKHYCPFGDLTDPSALPQIEAALRGAREAIEAIAGETVFETSSWATPNCIVVEPVEG